MMFDWAVLGLLLLCNIWSYWANRWWIRWINLAFAVMFAAIIAMLINDNIECYGAPKDVEFRQGMTICPGQTAHAVFTITRPEKDNGI